MNEEKLNYFFDRKTLFAWLLVILTPLIWLWPRFANPSFSLVDDIYDLEKFRSIADHFPAWWREEGFHGEPANGRLRPVFWLVRFIAYYLPAKLHPLGWIVLHYVNFAIALSFTFFFIKRLTHRNFFALLACALWIFSVSTIETYSRLGNQDLWQVLWISLSLLAAYTIFQTQANLKKTFLYCIVGSLLFALYFSKETSVVIFPFSVVLAAFAFFLDKNKKEWTIFLIVNALLFSLQRYFAPPMVGYSTFFKPSLDVILFNLKLYFFALQWHFLLLLLLGFFIFRIYQNRKELKNLSSEHWEFGILILGILFFMIILPISVQERRYLLIPDYFCAMFIALELQFHAKYFSKQTLIKWICIIICAALSLGYLPTKIVDVYAHAHKRTIVQALQWFSKQAAPNTQILLLEFDQELIYGTMEYLKTFESRNDIKVFSLSEYGETYQKQGYPIVRIKELSSQLADQLDYIIFYRHGSLRIPADRFHEQVINLLKQSEYSSRLQNIFRELANENSPFPDGIEIWKLNH